MKLNIKERLVLPTLFPQRSDIATALTMRDIKNKIDISIKEKEEVGLKAKQGRIHWDKSKARDIDITFNTVELNFLKDQVDRIDKEKNVTEDLLDLCLKIKNYES